MANIKLLHIDLFSGIGGFSLAAEWAGFETIGFVENDKYCQKVLKKHWPDVPLVEDIRNVEEIKEVVANPECRTCETKTTRWQEYQQDNQNKMGKLNMASSREYRTISGIPTNYQQPVTLITGGFPCQSFSVAGKRRGKEDDRYLWPEMLAVIKAIKPTWVLAENVAGIIPMALDTVLSNLVDTGYSTETMVIPACAINAPHRRDRVWIIAHNKCLGWQERAEQRIQSEEQVPEGQDTNNIHHNVPNTQRERLERSNTEGNSCRTGCLTKYEQRRRQSDWWAVEPELGRVAHGIPHRVDRLRCLGNAIVPQVAYEILSVIAKIEMGDILEVKGTDYRLT